MTNDTADNPGVRLPWAGKIVRIEEVEEQLSVLWKMSADNMRIDDLVDVSAGDVPIPDCLGIYDNIRPVLALVEASCLVSSHLALESALRELLLE